MFHRGRTLRLNLVDPLADAAAGRGRPAGSRRADAGQVVAVMSRPGDAVWRGHPLVVLEAMKMEHTLAAPADGVVEAVHYAVGDQVEEGVELRRSPTRTGSDS